MISGRQSGPKGGKSSDRCGESQWSPWPRKPPTAIAAALTTATGAATAGWAAAATTAATAATAAPIPAAAEPTAVAAAAIAVATAATTTADVNRCVAYSIEKVRRASHDVFYL